ncbi:MAG: hypothetical protein ACXWCR_14310, partial [Flavitalea sp.]
LSRITYCPNTSMRKNWKPIIARHLVFIVLLFTQKNPAANREATVVNFSSLNHTIMNNQTDDPSCCASGTDCCTEMGCC